MSEVNHEPMTPKQMALMLNTNARTVRKFLRSQRGKVGQGNRWGVDDDELEELEAAWNGWRAPIEERAAKKLKEAQIEESEPRSEMEMDL